MTFLEAALEILRHEGKPLHYKELTETALGKKLLTFVGRTPEVTMQTQLTAAVKKAPGNPFVRVKPGIFGLLRYPEVTAAERAAYAKADAAAAPAAKSAEAGRDGGRDGGRGRDRDAGGGRDGARDRDGRRGRRRRGRGGRGGEDEVRTERRPAVTAVGSGGGGGVSAGAAMAAAGEDADSDADEPLLAGLSPEARAAALAETGVLEGDDETTGDEEDETSMEDDEISPAGDAGDEVEGDDEGDDEEPVPGEGAAAGEAAAGGGAAGDERGPGGESGPGGELGRRRRRRRRRGGRGGEGGGISGSGGSAGSFGEGPRPSGSGSEGMATATGEAPRYADAGTGGEAGPSGEPGAPSMQGQGDDGLGGAPGGSGEGQGPRRIMTPVDAALEILRGQAPGRGVHVRQIADGATRRRLVHGEPNEAWRVMRTALAAEPRERLRAGLRPRVRSAGAGLYALARRPPDTELERAEQVFGEARRALRERTVAALERRIAELPGPAFEALARVLLQREGFGPATFVKRVEGTIYVEALRGRGPRSSRCLVGFKFGGGSGGRRAIGELRAGIRARRQDEGLLMLAGRLAEDAIGEWKQPGEPIEIADGPAMAETCIRHGVGVINTMVSVDFVDADFFADIAEG
jgi:hypothetical protein